jgi:hypothetical protein
MEGSDMRNAMLAIIGAFALAGCSNSVEGTYNMVNGPVPGVVATFGDKTFSLSSGASGTYEVSGDTVILSGNSLGGTYKIDGGKLVGDRFSFVPRDPNDKSPINRGPRSSGSMPTTGGKAF